MQYWLSITTVPEQDPLLDLARLPNPFFTADGYDPGADPSLFETNRAALERFSEQVLHAPGH